jgi:hypothetical protein
MTGMHMGTGEADRRIAQPEGNHTRDQLRVILTTRQKIRKASGQVSQLRGVRCEICSTLS